MGCENLNTLKEKVLLMLLGLMDIQIAKKKFLGNAAKLVNL